MLNFYNIWSDPDYDPKEAKRLEKELLKIESKKDVDKKQQPPKKVSKAGGLVAKLSPKSQRKKDTGANNIAQLKVQNYKIFMVRNDYLVFLLSGSGTNMR